MRQFSKEDIIQRLNAEVTSCGSQKVLAEKLGITQAYLCDVLKGRRDPADAIADYFKMKRETVFIERSPE